MFTFSVNKVLSLMVCLSLIVPGTGPIGLEAVNSILEINNGKNSPQAETSLYQPPKYEHQAPRNGRRTNPLNSVIGSSSSHDTLNPPPSSSTLSSPTPISTPMSPVNDNTTKLSENLFSTQNASLGGIDWVLNGNADSTTIPGAIKITDDNYMLAGSAWSSQQVDLSKNFDMTFAIYLGAKDGADGMAFVLQNVGTQALGDIGRGIGYWHISPSIEVELDTYWNYEQNDPLAGFGGNDHEHMALMRNGDIDHDSGLPYSLPWSGTEGLAWENGHEFYFRIQWNATTKTLIASTPNFWSGLSAKVIYTEDIVQTIFGGDSTVWFGFTGATAYDINLQYFYPAPNVNVLPEGTTKTFSSDNDETISCIAICSQASAGGPINTRNGAYEYSAKDMSIQTGAGEVSFERIYSTKARNIGPLGYGWTHNHDMSLFIGAYDSSTNFRTITLKGHTANEYNFTQQNGFTTTTPDRGVYASLTEGPSSFILTDRSQNTYEFDLTSGKLISYTIPNGQKILYTYDGKGRMSKISDQSNQQFLTLAYSGKGTNIVSITDHAGRKVSYGYDRNGNLTSVTDTQAKIWKYSYDSNHRILEVFDPQNVIIERTEYDTQGRALRQYNGSNELVVELTYNTDGTTTVRDALNNNEIHTYDNRLTLTQQTSATGSVTGTTYDQNFRPITITDPIGQTTAMEWSSDGADLTQIIDAGGGQADFTYDENHNLTSIIDQLSHLTTYTYSGTNLTSSTDALNKTTLYSYTPEGYLASQTDALGHVISYTYNAQGQRISMTDPLSKVWNYSYDSLGRLVDTTDPLGRVTHNEYDTAGRLTKVTRNYDASRPQNDLDQYNIVTKYTYDVRGNQTSVEDTYGRITNYAYDNAGRLITITDPAGNITTNAYDAAGRLISTTDALGNTTNYQYDASNRVITATNPAGGVTQTSYNPDGTVATTIDTLNRVTSYIYDEFKRVTQVTDPLSGITSYQYDALGNMVSMTNPLNQTTTYSYDALGRLITQTDPGGGITENFYDAVGNKIQTIDPRGNATTYTYDAANRLLTITDARGGVTTYEYDDLGRRTAMIDANNNRTTYGNDLLDRLVSTTDSLGHTTVANYDALGNTTTRTDGNGFSTTYQYDNLNRLTSQTDPMNGVMGYVYDAMGNRTSITDANNHTATTVYDSLYRPITVTDPNNHSTNTIFDAVGNVLSIIDPLGNTTTYTYDGLNRQTAVTDALLNTTQYEYDAAGNQIGLIAANGVVTHYEYDTLNRLSAVVENYQPAFGADSQTNVRTEYTYDLNGNRLTILDGNGHITTFAYDELNRLVQETDPLGYAWTYTYDALGNRTSLTDANLMVAQYTYDVANQLIQINYPDPDSDVSFTYDNGGRRLTMTDGSGVTTWTYDSLNRTTTIIDPYTATIGYGYDAVGNRTTLTYPGRSVANYTYDNENRLLTVDGLSSVTNYTYDDADRLTGIGRSNGTNTAYTYDNANRLTGLAHTLNAQVLGSYQYTYDPVGNRTQAIEQMNMQDPPIQTTVTTDYIYDPLSCLKEANYSDNRYYHYTYDSVGNRLSQQSHLSSETYTYDIANRLININATTYTWDNNGNLLTNGGSTYTYDHANRMVEVSQATVSAGYVYNGLGDRVRETVNGVPTTFTLDLNSGLTQVLSDGTNSYLYGNERIAQMIGMESA